MANFAILAWLVIAPMLFSRLSAPKAIIWAVVLPYLFLPERFAIGLSGLPDLDKTACISIGLVLGFLLNRNTFRVASAQHPVALTGKAVRIAIIACVTILVFGLVLTVINNGESLIYGALTIPGLGLWDGISLVGTFVLLIIPFLFAQRYLVTPESHRLLLSALVVMGLVYSLFMLVEIRLSPQFNMWVYGYHQSSFVQHVRDGFRPKVFLQHGIWLGFFMFMTVIAAAAMWKTTRKIKWLWIMIWLFAVLAISRNLGALSLTVLFLGVFLLLGSFLQIRVAAVVAILVLLFPAVRQSQFSPIPSILEMAARISDERASSLQYRLDNEDRILERAALKPLAGWGSFGRDRIYNESGDDTSVSEGLWTQTLGRQGWIGYIGFFGLLTAAVIFLPRTRRRKSVPPETVALAMMIAGNLVYVIPNSTLTPVCMLVFGALSGFVQYDAVATPASSGRTSETPKAGRHTRFPPRSRQSKASGYANRPATIGQ